MLSTMQIMKSRFRAAMKAKSLPWQNLTKMFESDQESNMTGSEFQYSLLEVLINQAQFSFDPNGVSNLYHSPLRSYQKSFIFRFDQ